MDNNHFSLFYNGIANTHPNEEITIEQFIDKIKTDTPLFQQIRANANNKEEKDKLKSRLSYVTFGGVFSYRNANSLIKSSGYACLDVDDVENLEDVKQQIIQNKFTHCLFTSPSGKGYKFIVKIPEVKTNEEYKQYWVSIARHYNLKDNDEGTKDICRACYLSFDSEPYFNSDSETYTDKADLTVQTSFTSSEAPKDTSRSAKEFGEVCRLAKKGLSDEEIDKQMMAFAKWSGSHPSYKDLTIKKAREKSLENASKIFTREGQIEEFYKTNPFFYDKSKMFFIWNNELCRYELSDTTDLLNKVSDILGLDTINPKVRNELISGFEQVGRRHIPMTAPLSWVQYKDRICDFKSGEIFESSPEYFITNPIPFDIGESEETPVIDDIFSQWVGEDYKETLYQVIAYCVSSDQFMQRLIALVGGGSNGKGTFIKLVKKFIGKDNLCTSELKELSNGGFETSAIYKKLVCFMGEVSYDDLKNTNQIKKLAGEDDIRYCFKGKTAFSDISITTLISATNSLPKTPDKTLGFYRKWLIIDFPNQFEGINKDIIANIPEIEFNNLAKKTLRILKELYKTQKFHNEGNFEERVSRYEERSNPLQKFIETQCKEAIGEKVELRNFSNCFNEYAKKNHLRIMTVRQISKILKDDGFELGTRSIEQGQNKSTRYFILNLVLKLNKKTNETNETNENPKRLPYKETVENFVSSVSSVSSDEFSPVDDLIQEVPDEKADSD